MITHLTLKQGQRSNSTLAKVSQVMIFTIGCFHISNSRDLWPRVVGMLKMDKRCPKDGKSFEPIVICLTVECSLGEVKIHLQY